MPEGQFAGIAAIRYNRSTEIRPAGMGIVTDARHVVTCAHVINEALGRPLEEARKPGSKAQVHVVFPLSGVTASVLSRRVIVWYPMTNRGRLSDIAVLEFGEDIPQAVGRVEFAVKGRLLGKRYYTFGYPPDGDPRKGGYSDGKFMGPVGDGTVELNGIRFTGNAIDHGFSGAGVWHDSLRAVVGMASSKAADASQRIAYMIPVSQMLKAWSDLPIVRKRRNGRRDRRPVFSIARLPPPSSDLLVGRDRIIEKLNEVWETGLLKPDGEPTRRPIHIVQFHADGGVGKSAAVWHWLNRLKRRGDGRLQHVLEWSFFSQGRNDYIYDSQTFRDAALRHFARVRDRFAPKRRFELFALGDNPGQGRVAERVGEAIGDVFMAFDGVLILDGTEPLQYPPQKAGGALSDDGLRGLVAFLRNQPMLEGEQRWLLIITTRYPIPDLVGTGIWTQPLASLADRDGAQLLQEFHLQDDSRRLTFEPHVNRGRESRIRREFLSASREYGGHPLALTLLASFLLYRWNGDLARRHQVPVVPPGLENDPYRHARRIMGSYDRILKVNGSPLSQSCRQVLCLVGLFSRPAEPTLIRELLHPPPIPGLTDKLTGEGLQVAITELRRLRLLNPPAFPGDEALDSHPLVREHFGREVLQRAHAEAWLEGHNRLYQYLKTIAARQPDSAETMEPLFQAVTHGCQAGRHQEALQDVYLPRIMRDNQYYAFGHLGLVGSLLSTVSHFFRPGHWDEPIAQSDADGAGLTISDQVTVLSHAALFLMVTRGYADPDVENICNAALRLCAGATTPQLFSALSQFWIYYLVRADLKQAWNFAEKLLDLTQAGSAADRRIEAYYAAGVTQLMFDRLPESQKYLEQAIELYVPEKHAMLAFLHIHDIGVASRCFLGRVFAYLDNLDKALKLTCAAERLARKLRQPYSLVFAQVYLGWIHLNRGENPQALRQLERAQSSCRSRGFWFWEAVATILRSRILADLKDRTALAEASRGIDLYKKTGAALALPYFISVATDVHIQFGEMRAAGKLLDEAFAVAKKIGYEQDLDYAELCRIRGELLARKGVSRREIRKHFLKALKHAQHNKSPGAERLVLESMKRIGIRVAAGARAPRQR